jgi:hypothetical protein
MANERDPNGGRHPAETVIGDVHKWRRTYFNLKSDAANCKGKSSCGTSGLPVSSATSAASAREIEAVNRGAQS